MSKKSLLKTWFSVDFLEYSHEVKVSTWFKLYLEGEKTEFYIEGSRGYYVTNIDLISHEIYVTKQALLAQLEPRIFFCYQTEYTIASDLFRGELQASLKNLNFRSRLPLTLIESSRPNNAPLRFNHTRMRKICKSLLFIGDTIAITSDVNLCLELQTNMLSTCC